MHPPHQCRALQVVDRHAARHGVIAQVWCWSTTYFVGSGGQAHLRDLAQFVDLLFVVKWINGMHIEVHQVHIGL
jgi:hypothetical protein